MSFLELRITGNKLFFGKPVEELGVRLHNPYCLNFVKDLKWLILKGGVQFLESSCGSSRGLCSVLQSGCSVSQLPPCFWCHLKTS